MEGVHNVGGHASVRIGGVSLYLPLDFSVNLKLCQKNSLKKSYKMENNNNKR